MLFYWLSVIISHLIYIFPFGITVCFLSHYEFVSTWDLGRCVFWLGQPSALGIVSLKWPCKLRFSTFKRGGHVEKAFWRSTRPQEITWAVKSHCWPRCTVTSASASRLLIMINRIVVIAADRLLVIFISLQIQKEWGINYCFMTVDNILVLDSASSISLWTESR